MTPAGTPDRAIRFSAFGAICRELDCRPGDLLVHDP
ncbi:MULTISPECIES: helix-turn-helix transcriptional regulator [Planomonospora]|nr:MULTISPECIES: helix-turn-helix domain-containing protein [Planomonospora]